MEKINIYTTNPKAYSHIAEISLQMTNKGIDTIFVAGLTRCAKEYEGIYDLMVLWQGELDVKEKQACLDDLKEIVIECVKNLSKHNPPFSISGEVKK